MSIFVRFSFLFLVVLDMLLFLLQVVKSIMEWILCCLKISMCHWLLNIENVLHIFLFIDFFHPSSP